MTTLENIHWSGVSPRAYFIAGYIERVGLVDDDAYHITLQDASDLMGISPRTIVRGLKELIDRGVYVADDQDADLYILRHGPYFDE